MGRPSRPATAAAVLLIASLACNMPAPGQPPAGSPTQGAAEALPDMSLEEAVAIDSLDSRNDVLFLMGAPDAFSLHWQPVAGQSVRWEEWSYFDGRARFDFVDGELVWTADLGSAPDGSLFAQQYDPTAFDEGDRLEDLQGVLNVLGPQELETVPLDEADAPGGEMVIGDQILMGFDQGRLVSVDTFVLAPNSALSGSTPHALAAQAPARVRASGFAPSLPSRALGPQQVGLSNVVPLVGFFVGWSHRNRVYRQAEEFITDRNDYYDHLRDTARQQLVNRDVGGLRSSQVAAYTKLVAMIEDHRQAELAVAEASKNEARQAFNQRVQGILTQRLIGIGMVQRVFGAVTKGVNTSQNLLDNAIQGLSGGAGGVLGDIQRIQGIAHDVERWAAVIGGPTGAGLRAAAGRIAGALGHPQDVIRADLEKVQPDLQNIQDTVDTLARAGRTPSAGALASGLVFGPAASEDPAVQAVTILVSKLSVGDGSLKDQAQAALDAGFVGRCTAIAEAYRAALDRLEAGAGEALSAEQAAAPCQAIDPAALAAQAPASEPTQESADQAAPVGGDTGLDAFLSVASVHFEKANCFVSSVNGWTFCDVTEDLVLDYETSQLPATIDCFMLDDDYSVDLTDPAGTLNFHDDDEQRNVSERAVEHDAGV